MNRRFFSFYKVITSFGISIILQANDFTIIMGAAGSNFIKTCDTPRRKAVKLLQIIIRMFIRMPVVWTRQIDLCTESTAVPLIADVTDAEVISRLLR